MIRLNNPRVSVITVVLNDEKNISRTLISIKKQNYSNIQHIIIDGDSTDNTKSIIKKKRMKKSLFFSEKDKNLYDAINKGIKLSTGKYIYLLHSGDVFYSNDVLKKKIYFAENNKLDFVFSDIYYYNFKIKRIIRKMKYGFFSKFYFRFGLQPPHCSFLIKKNLVKKLNYYSTKYNIAGDFDFLLRLFYYPKARFKHLSIISILQSIGGLSDTHLFAKKKVFLEICKILKKHKVFHYKFFFLLKFFFKIKEKF